MIRMLPASGRGSRAWPICLLTILAMTWLAAVPEAQARPRPRATKFQANKTVGLGFMVGAPTALAFKYYLSGDTALDAGVGVIQGVGRRDGLHVHADFLWHPAVLASSEPFLLPLYVGMGGRVFDFDDEETGDDDLSVGARVPVGIMLDFNNVPIDVFFELALVVDFIVGDGDARADFGGALGFRYYFQ